MDARSTELDIPAHCADLFDQGSQYYFNGKPDQALTCYESVWLKHPQNEAIIYR
jgi:hypothetical protein